MVLSPSVLYYPGFGWPPRRISYVQFLLVLLRFSIFPLIRFPLIVFLLMNAVCIFYSLSTLLIYADIPFTYEVTEVIVSVGPLFDNWGGPGVISLVCLTILSIFLGYRFLLRVSAMLLNFSFRSPVLEFCRIGIKIISIRKNWMEGSKRRHFMNIQ